MITKGGGAVIDIALIAGAALVGNEAAVKFTEAGQLAKPTTEAPTFGVAKLSCAIIKYCIVSPMLGALCSNETSI